MAKKSAKPTADEVGGVAEEDLVNEEKKNKKAIKKPALEKKKAVAKPVIKKVIKIAKVKKEKTVEEDKDMDEIEKKAASQAVEEIENQ